jgi:hypothetical protein
MVAAGRVPHDRLVARFREMVDYVGATAYADDLPRCVDRLHRIERDMLDVDETPIELPSWVE